VDTIPAQYMQVRPVQDNQRYMVQFRKWSVESVHLHSERSQVFPFQVALFEEFD
jgi:hypothetical protein